MTIAPLQHVEPGDLAYQATNNDRLQYDVPTCFPVLPLIHGYVDAGEAIEVHVLTTDGHKNASENYLEMERKIYELCQQRGASCSVSKIGISFNETIETHLNTFKTLIGLISDGDTLLVDITFGSKCLPIIMMMAMNYGYRVCKDCTVDCLVYGSMDFRDGHPFGRRIFDITSLFLMDQIVNELAKSRNKNPMETIESILAMNTRIKDGE